jgi:hypothetical protein
MPVSRLAAGADWLFTCNFVKRGASGLQPRRAFFIDRGTAAATTIPGHRNLASIERIRLPLAPLLTASRR